VSICRCIATNLFDLTLYADNSASLSSSFGLDQLLSDKKSPYA
jgi:hypothetical protein